MTAQATNAILEKTIAEGGDDLGGKYLTFKLADEIYGLEILKVREIVKIMDITLVPQMPGYVKGVVNLRGKVIPVIDLRLRFGLPEAEYTDETCIIVVNLGGTETGVVVDTVQEVADIRDSQIEPPPSVGHDVDTKFILGMGKVGERVNILLDIDRILGGEEIAALEAISED
ncbi:MAG: purine-binding chemotaxis protein CheW [Phycisphaerae bacterium]|nr:purine-binding chemotaxis protein CheW [Phycisphaerae bacterium]